MSRRTRCPSTWSACSRDPGLQGRHVPARPFLTAITLALFVLSGNLDPMGDYSELFFKHAHLRPLEVAGQGWAVVQQLWPRRGQVTTVRQLLLCRHWLASQKTTRPVVGRSFRACGQDWDVDKASLWPFWVPSVFPAL